MHDQIEPIGKFAFTLLLHSTPQGSVECFSSSSNENVPIEFVIMQLCACVRNLEKDYFDNFDRDTIKF